MATFKNEESHWIKALIYWIKISFKHEQYYQGWNIITSVLNNGSFKTLNLSAVE